MVVADALARWHRLLGDEVFFLTGTDEHGLKIARAAEEQGVAPQEWVDSMSESLPRRLARARHLERRLHPHDRGAPPRAASSSSCRRSTTTATSTRASTRGGTASRARPTTAESELGRGPQLPDPRPTRRVARRGELLLRAVALRRATARVVRPASRGRASPRPAQRGARLSSARVCEDISITRTSFDWGIPVPWDDEHVVYVWFDALVNYAHRVGYGEDEERFAAWWPAAHHLIGKDIVRFHCVWWPAMCMAAGIDPPPAGHRPRLAARRRREDVEVEGEPGRPASSSPSRRRRRRPPLPPAPRGHPRLDGDFTYEGLVARYNADLANNLGNLLSPGHDRRRLEVRRHRSGPRAGRCRQPAGSARRRGRVDVGPRGLGRGRRRTRRSRRPGG